LHPKHAQFLRNRSGNTGTADARPAGEIQQHVKPNIIIGEALRASGEKQRNTIRNFILDLRGEALVVEVSGLRGFSRRSARLPGSAPWLSLLVEPYVGPS
jgi:hypothetical protein